MSLKSIKIFFFIILLISSGYSDSIAQNVGMKISGTVTDEKTGEPIVSANIIVTKKNVEEDKSFTTGAATDSEGKYRTPHIPQGTYEIKFRSISYEEKIEIVVIERTSGTLLLDVTLLPESVKLEEVVIKDKMENDEIISVVDISPKTLALLPSISGEIDIFKSLQLLPGVKVASEMSNGIYVRGGSPDQNLTLVDGTLLYNPSHLGNIASTFNTYALYDVKLIKGAFPAEYGGRLSSVLDVKLREGTNEREKGIIGIGTIMSHATLEGPITDQLTYIISGRVMYYDQLQKVFQAKSVTPRYNFYDINTKFNYNFTKDQFVALNFMYSSDHIYSPPVNLGFKYMTSWSNASASVNWVTMKSDLFVLTTNVSYIHYNFTSSLDDITSDSLANDYFSSSKLKDISAKQNIEMTFSEFYKIKTGYEFVFHNYDLVNWILYHPVLEHAPDYSERHFSYEFSMFLQNEWKPFSFLNTNLGVRFYKFSNSSEIKIEPRLSLGISLTDNFRLKSAYAEAHQFLHLVLRNDLRLPTDLWYPSTKNILPSESRQAVAGFDIFFDEKTYMFSIEGYYKDFNNIYEFKDMPEYSLLNPIEEHFTIGKGEAYGIEFFFNKRAGRISGWLGYTISWTKRLFSNLNAEQIFPPRYDRLHDVSLVLTYEIIKDLNFGLTWTYATGSGLTMPTGKYYYKNNELDGSEKLNINYSSRNEYKLPDYHKLDVNIRYTTQMFSLETDFYLNIYNAYNQDNAFAQYIAYDFDPDKNEFDYTSTPKLNQITLMPFFPSIGFSVKF